MLKEIKNLILPTKAELFFWTALALLLLILQNISRFWQYFSGINFEDVKNASNVATNIESWALSSESMIDPRIADFIIWMLLGMIAISVVLFIQSSARNANDERDLLEHMRNPSNRPHEIEVYTLRLAVRVGAVLGFLIYLRIFISAINQNLSDLFFVSALRLNDPSSWLWLLISILGMAVGLYIFAIFARVVMLRTRIIN